MLNEDLELKSRYVWLRIPVISWLILVFPLVLPPIPLGPVQFSLSWDRFEEVDLVKRARRFASRPGRALTFPMGWVVNLILNLVDLATLGLRSAFMAAWLADEVNAKATERGGGEAISSQVKWLVKWLLLGNVVFLAAWVIYPGWVLLRFVESIEHALYAAYNAEPVNVDVVASGTTEHRTIQAKPALSSSQLLEASKNKLVLLGVFTLPLAANETNEDKPLVDTVSAQVLAAAEQILQHDVAVFWCNVAENYPTHYRQTGSLLPKGVKTGGKWVAFRDGKVLCTATSASESIAKALNIPAVIRAIDNMRVDAQAGGLGSIQEDSLQRPVVLFIYGGGGPSGYVKDFSPLFLETVQVRNVGVRFIKLEKKGLLSDELRKNDLLWTGCVIWQKRQPVERIKMGFLTAPSEVITKVCTWLSSVSEVSKTGTASSVEHRYRSLPCYALSRWDQVMELSAKQPLILASGAGMDSKRAESVFLRWVGSIFVDRGFFLAVAPTESEAAEDSVASGLLFAGLKADGCYVVQNGRVTGTIAKTSPQGGEGGWLNDAVTYLAES